MKPPPPQPSRLSLWVDDRLWNLNLPMADEIPSPPPPPPPAPERKRKRRYCLFIEDEDGADNKHVDDDDEEKDFGELIDPDDL